MNLRYSCFLLLFPLCLIGQDQDSLAYENALTNYCMAILDFTTDEQGNCDCEDSTAPVFGEKSIDKERIDSVYQICYRSHKKWLATQLYRNHPFDLSTEHVYLTGRFGAEKSCLILIDNIFKKTQQLTLSAQGDDFSFPKHIDLKELEQDSFEIKVKFKTLTNRYFLKLENQEGISRRILVTAEAYDLCSDDFTVEGKAKFCFRKSNTITIKSPSKEKLLFIKDKKGTVLETIPVGLKYTAIDVGQFKRGKYLFEIVDLGTNKKRKLWVRL